MNQWNKIKNTSYIDSNIMLNRNGISNQCVKDGMWSQGSHNILSNKCSQDNSLFIWEILFTEQIPVILKSTKIKTLENEG